MGFMQKIQNDAEFMRRCDSVSDWLYSQDTAAIEADTRNDGVILNCLPYVDKLIKCTERAVREAYENRIRARRDIEIAEVRFGDPELRIMGICRGFHEIWRDDISAYTEKLIRPESEDKFLEILQRYEPSISYVGRRYNELHGFESSDWLLRQTVYGPRGPLVHKEPLHLVVVKFDPPLSPAS